MTHIADPSKYPTKKSFREAVMADPKRVHLADPAVVGAVSGAGGQGLRDQPPDEIVVRLHSAGQEGQPEGGVRTMSDPRPGRPPSRRKAYFVDALIKALENSPELTGTTFKLVDASTVTADIPATLGPGERFTLTIRENP